MNGCRVTLKHQSETFYHFSLKHFFFEKFRGHSVKLATIISDELWELTFQRKFTLGKKKNFSMFSWMSIAMEVGFSSKAIIAQVSRLQNVKQVGESHWESLTQLTPARLGTCLRHRAWAQTWSIASSSFDLQIFESKSSSSEKLGVIGPKNSVRVPGLRSTCVRLAVSHRREVRRCCGPTERSGDQMCHKINKWRHSNPDLCKKSSDPKKVFLQY